MITTTTSLKPGREKSARNRHPWIFSGAISDIQGTPAYGDLVRVVDATGAFVAYGYHNAQSQIAIRLLEWNEAVVVDDDWWASRLAASIRHRDGSAQTRHTNALRLVYGEADRLPGLIVDRYAEHLVIQVLTAGIERIKPLIVEQLQALIQPAGIIERADEHSRRLEGLPPARGPIAGATPAGEIEIHEENLRFAVDLLRGQKTGFYLDQRDNRRLAAGYALDREVLDGFAYTGAFTVHALHGGAKSVTCVESSAPSIRALQQNLELNNMGHQPVESVCDNVFEVLRRYRDEGRAFDMVILDPPKLAPTRSHVEKALRSYKDLNLLAMKILRPDGILVTFSCSGGVTPLNFQTAVAWAAQDAGRDVQILQRLAQPGDHPVLLSFPESEYLKGLICRVV